MSLENEECGNGFGFGIKLTPGPKAFDISSDRDRGILKEIIYDGWGEAKPRPGTNVEFFHQGWFDDGKLINASHDVYQPIMGTIGAEWRVPALEPCVSTMKIGERARFFCRPDMKSELGFLQPMLLKQIIHEVELIGWQSQDLSKHKDKSFLKDIIKDGSSTVTPVNFASVEVDVIGRVYLSNSQPFYKSSSLSFLIGDLDDDLIPSDIQQNLAYFHKGEKSRFLVKWLYGLKPEHLKKYQLNRTDTLEYTITLKKFSKLKNPDECGNKEKIKYVKMLKQLGTKQYKRDCFAFALKSYHKATEYLKESFNTMAEEIERRSLAVAIHLNSSLCLLKLNQFGLAIMECDIVLAIDEKNIKAMYRKGQALMSMNKFEEAKNNFESVIRLDPKNTSASNYLQKCKVSISNFNNFQTNVFEDMFKNFPIFN